jgi:acyl-CoA thioesterase
LAKRLVALLADAQTLAGTRRGYSPAENSACFEAIFGKAYMMENKYSDERMGVTADELAEACAAEMSKKDAASAALDIERLECKAGRSVIAMTIKPSMINGHGSAHGGFIFTLADCAISLASNSYNERTVAASASISFLRPCKAGDRLIATAVEVARFGRSCIYDVRVARDGVPVAEFRGTTRAIGGAVALVDPLN